MPIDRMEHFLVLTDDIEATRGFYRDVLGFADGQRPELGFAGYWLYLGDTPAIHIADFREYTAHSDRLGIPVTKPAPGTGPLDHVAFNASDYEGMIARIEQAGLAVHRHDTPAIGLRQLFIEDPNRLKLEINFWRR